MSIAFEIEWWMLPLSLMVIGYFVSNWWYKKYYTGAQYDFATPMIAMAILIAFILVAVAGTIGYWIAR